MNSENFGFEDAGDTSTDGGGWGCSVHVACGGGYEIQRAHLLAGSRAVLVGLRVVDGVP